MRTQGRLCVQKKKSTVLVAENYTNPPRVQLDTRLTCGERLGSARAFGSDDQRYLQRSRVPCSGDHIQSRPTDGSHAVKETP